MSVMANAIIRILLFILKKLGWRTPVPPRTKIYVLAANRQHFDYWCKISGINPRSKDIVYVNDSKQLLGIDPRSAIFVIYETWMDHPNSAELYNRVGMLKDMVEYGL